LKPTVLVTTTTCWFPTARLAVAFAKSGFAVKAVCPPDHPLRKTSVVGKMYSYDSFTPEASFAAAIDASEADLVIPGDDLATCCLYALYQRSRHRGQSGEAHCQLIERSLGPSASFAVASARSALIQLAAQEGIRAPQTGVVADIGDLRRHAERLLFPLVLKADGTSSGEGVKVARTQDEAERAFRSLQSPPSVARAAKRALIDHDLRLVLPLLLRKKKVVNAQEFIDGQDATSLVACWSGKIVASLHFEVVKKQYKNGPASVMRKVDNIEMASATAKIVARLNLSGLHGFDFLLERETGHVYLIEMNPRATQVGHLTLGPGRDLPAALYAHLTGTSLQEAPTLTEKDMIALFPQEWMRNPSSPFLKSAYHDIPWEEPELIRAAAHMAKGLTALYTKGTSVPLFSHSTAND